MANVPAALTRYAAAGRDAVGLADKLVDLFRGVMDDEARARRLRRRAARVLRRAHAADARGNRDRGAVLRTRATDLWREADGLDGGRGGPGAGDGAAQPTEA